MTDAAHKETDKLIDDLTDELRKMYAQASEELQAKADAYFEKFADKDKAKLSQLQSGKITKKEYQQWRTRQMLTGKRWQEMSEVLATDMTHSNEIAADIINGHKSSAYALNHNYGVFEVESSTGFDTSYVLYDHDTVERLVAQDPDILPKTKIDIPKDKAWNTKKIGSAISQAVLQGEAIPDISKRLSSVAEMNYNAAVRNARTAMTGAENAGRVDSYKRALKQGIEVEQTWIATLDGRTRHSHRLLMGETVAPGKKFSNGCKYPGDPAGPGWEVYNCRCTLIAKIPEIDYNLEGYIDANLKSKGMTFDEWVNEKPLSKHTNETKAQYLARYSEYKKKQSFSQWLEDQAMPDSAITNVWANKKMSQVYNEIKAQNVTDANKFYKELGKLGKPSDVWEKYLTGQLDAEDLKAFETILKKYLPQAPSSAAGYASAAKVASAVDDVSDAAKAAEAKLKFTKGNPMTKEEADTYKVNPLHDAKDYGTTHNCQTSTFAYECRRQGYDVTALPKMVDKNNVALADYGDIGVKQKLLGQDQANGWINKKTGLAPQSLFSGDNNIKENLEKIIGTNGERYSFSVQWKGGGAHALNLDRDANGVIRIIDNQRGPLEKNTWTLDEYLSTHNVATIKAVYRLDDCVPNPEYFNTIVVDASKMKVGLPKKVSDLSSNEYGQLYKIAKAKGESPSLYYSKWKFGIIDDSDLDNIFLKTAKTPDAEDIVKAQLKKKTYTEAMDSLDDVTAKEIKDIVTEVANDNGLTYAEYWHQYMNGKILDPEIDALLKNAKIVEKVSDETVEDLTKFLTAVEKKSDFDADKIWNKIDSELTVKHKMTSDDVWKKYLAGEIKDADLDSLVKPYGVVPKNELTAYKEKILKNMASSNDEISAVLSAAANDGQFFTNDYVVAYLKGEKSNDYLDDLLKKMITPQANDAVVSQANSIAEFVKNDLEYIINSSDSAQHKYLQIYDTISDIDDNLMDELNIKLVQLKHAGDYDTKYDVLTAYFNGDLKDDAIDEIFKKLYKDEIPESIIKSSAASASAAPEVDYFVLSNKKMSQVYNELKADNVTNANKFYNELKGIGKPSDVWEKYINGELTDAQQAAIDKYVISKYGKASAAIDYSKYGGKEVYDILKKYDTYDSLAYLSSMNEVDKVWDFFKDSDKVKAAHAEIHAAQKTAEKTAEKSKELIKAEENLKKAQDELIAAQEALKKNVDTSEIWSGIWKGQDVTVEDYAKKKSTIAAKKQYYEDTIKDYENKIAAGDGVAWHQDQIDKLKQQLNKLEQFEIQGQQAEQYYAAIEKAQKKVTAAQQNVYKHSPGPAIEKSGYSKERKDAAAWPKSRSEADKLYLSKSQQEWDAATSTEREAIKHYTQSYHKYNEPLRGIEYGSNSYKGVGHTDLNAGSAANGKRLNAMTDYLEKCSSERDQWMQRGCGFSGMDKFFNVSMDLLKHGSEKELQDALLGKTVTEYGFMSCGSAKGKGFTGDILLNIFTPAGTKMSYAELYSYYKGGSEVETILQQGSQFIITKVEKSYGQIYIDIEFIGNLPPQRWKP